MFKKTILLCPSKYSLNNIFQETLLNISDELVNINIRNFVTKNEIRINTQMFRFPASIRNKWLNYYQNKINQKIINEFKIHNPEMVFIYNNEMLLPETIVFMRKSAKVVFFLGDTPYFTPTNNYFLTLLDMADAVLVPDSFWLQQMQTIGIDHSFLFIPGIDNSSYHKEADIELMQQISDTDVLYCGMSYANSWGYKKAMLMSNFTGFNFEIYGDSSWKRWFKFFPELKKVFRETGFIPTPKLNAMFNKTKIIPVDGNPAILNGFHIRMFEALGAGVLPLIEYRKDVEDVVFKDLDIEIPVMRSYKAASSLAERYLSDEGLRLKTVEIMKNHIHEKYNAQENAKRLIHILHKLND